MATKRQVAEISTTPPRAPGVVIAQPETSEVVLEVMGSAPLIQNNFSQKAVEQMLRKHMGISVQREKKNPRQVIEDATIKNVEGRVCLPPAAFKKAMITASVQVKGLKKTQLRTQLFVVGGSIPILFKEMKPRMDMVRTSGMSRTPDVRFRPMFSEWTARVAIQFTDPLALQTVVDLLNRAGSGLASRGRRGEVGRGMVRAVRSGRARCGEAGRYGVVREGRVCCGPVGQAGQRKVGSGPARSGEARHVTVWYPVQVSDEAGGKVLVKS